MKKPTKIEIKRIDAFLDSGPTRIHEQVVGRVLTCTAILLVIAIVLAFEMRLPPELRIGFFEATYVSP